VTKLLPSTLIIFGNCPVLSSDQITSLYPHHLQKMYHFTTSLLGHDASFLEITEAMNQQIAVYHHLLALALNQISLYRWFKKQCQQLMIDQSNTKKRRMKK
jgi:hypothetical protein